LDVAGKGLPTLPFGVESNFRQDAGSTLKSPSVAPASSQQTQILLSISQEKASRR